MQIELIKSCPLGDDYRVTDGQRTWLVTIMSDGEHIVFSIGKRGTWRRIRGDWLVLRCMVWHAQQAA